MLCRFLKEPARGSADRASTLIGEDSIATSSAVNSEDGVYQEELPLTKPSVRTFLSYVIKEPIGMLLMLAFSDTNFSV